MNSSIPKPSPIGVKLEKPLVVATFQAVAYPSMNVASDSDIERTASNAGPAGVSVSSQSPNEALSSWSQQMFLFSGSQKFQRVAD